MSEANNTVAPEKEETHALVENEGISQEAWDEFGRDLHLLFAVGIGGAFAALYLFAFGSVYHEQCPSGVETAGKPACHNPIKIIGQQLKRPAP